MVTKFSDIHLILQFVYSFNSCHDETQRQMTFECLLLVAKYCVGYLTQLMTLYV